MSLFDQGWGEDLSDSFESFNHAPVDNTHDFMDQHGEKVTKAFMIAALAYALGGAGGGGGGEAAGGGGGGMSSGGWIPQAMRGAKGMLGNLGNMGGGGDNGPEYSTKKRRSGILAQPQTRSPLFGDDDSKSNSLFSGLYP